MAREELRLMRSFEEFRPGLPIALVVCPCGSRHNAMALNESFSDGHPEHGRRWTCVPNPHPEFGVPFEVTEAAVRNRKICIRLDGLDSEQTTTRMRELERVK